MSDKFQQLHFICILQIRISGRGILSIFGTMHLHTLLILCFPSLMPNCPPCSWCRLSGWSVLSSTTYVPSVVLCLIQCLLSCACSLLFKLPVSSPPAAADRCFQPLPDRSNAPSACPCSPQTSPTDHADTIKTPLTASQSLFLPLGPRYNLATQILCLCSFKTLYLEIYQNCLLHDLFMLILLQKNIFKQGIKHFSARFYYVFVSSYLYATNFSCSVFVKQLKSGCFSNV